MTTSYEDTSTFSSNMPSRDSDGYEVWNPSVGIYHKPAKNKRESYGGIIGALQDLMVEEGAVVKSYPENFAGIIAAIRDLDIAVDKPGSDTGDKPPGGGIIINPDTGLPDWIITTPPQNGQLWFDTRQGRLFVWVEDDWYQTNGADGLPIVTNGQTPNVLYPVPGQFWWDAANNDLFIFDGAYQLNGNIVPPETGGALPVWKLIAGDDEDSSFQNTATLPLAVIGPRVTATSDWTYLPEIIVGERQMDVQKDYNEWLFESLLALDVGLAEFQPVIMSDTPPPSDEVEEGQLWYDTESLEMSIWYVDDDTSQWVPIHSAHSYDRDLADITTSIAKETRLRETAIHDLYERIGSLDVDITDDKVITDLQSEVETLSRTVNAIPIYDSNAHYSKAYVDTKLGELTSSLSFLNSSIPDVTPYAEKETVSQLTDVVSTLASQTDVAAVASQIPDVSSFITADYVTQSIANITTDYLPRTGGKLTGNFVLENNDISAAALDFATYKHSSVNAFKFSPHTPTPNHYTTFGATDNFWEYAWKFKAQEDFCWIYNDTNKVFSITKEGPACSQLYLGDFSTNGSNGRVITNKIDVKDRLTKYQTAFQQMRQAISSSTDYASLKSGLLTALANV